MTTRDDLHDLVNELPEEVLVAAEAFLTFLRNRDRTATRPAKTTPAPRQFSGQDWADNARRGLKQRRQERDATEHRSWPNNHA